MPRFLHISRGFTLLELVVALTIGSIVIAFAAALATAPVDAYLEQSDRSAVSDSAEIVTRRLDADLRHALPNSVSVSNTSSGMVIEMLLVEQIAFYRTADLGDDARHLAFGAPETSFSVFGRLDPERSGTYSLDGKRLVIGNAGRNTPRNVYQPNAEPGVVIPANRAVQVSRLAGNEERVDIEAPGFTFRAIDMPANVTNRVFVVTHPVAYVCNASARTLRRYENYPISPSLPMSDASAQLQSAESRTLLADNMRACVARCAGTDFQVCRDTLAIQLEFARASASGSEERLRVHRQFDMDNDP